MTTKKQQDESILHKGWMQNGYDDITVSMSDRYITLAHPSHDSYIALTHEEFERAYSFFLKNRPDKEKSVSPAEPKKEETLEDIQKMLDAIFPAQ